MKTGYHAVYERSYFEAIDAAKDNGFDFVQFDLGVPTFFLDSLNDNDLKAIRDYAKDRGVRLTFHAPGDNVSLFCDYPKIRRGILDQFLTIVEKANKLEARHITFHAGEYPIFRKSRRKCDDYTDLYGDYYAEVLYQNILELTRATGDTLICFENSGLTDPTMRTLNKLIHDGEKLYLTLDIAKCYNKNCGFDRTVFEFMKGHGDRIREVHIHDRNKEYGGHQIVGDGIVDFELFREYLFDDRIYMDFEVRPVESAVESKRRLIELFHK